MERAESVPDQVAGDSGKEITKALDEVVAEIGEGIDPFVAEASRRTLETAEWSSDAAERSGASS
jgi:hypothetical protein